MKNLLKRSHYGLKNPTSKVLVPALLILCMSVSCQKKGVAPEAVHSKESQAGAVLETPTPSTLWFEEVIANLPLSFEKKQIIFESLDKSGNAPIPANLLFAEDASQALPSLPLAFLSKSRFDSKELSFFVLAPSDPDRGQGIVLHLSKQTFPKRPMLSEDVWHLAVEPRQALGFRWIGEADLFSQLESFFTLYPETKGLPLFVYSPAPFTEEGFRLASLYRSQFSALIFSGRQNGVYLTNFEEFPLIYLEGENLNKGIFEGDKILKAAENRGNPNVAKAQTLKQAVSIAKGLAKKSRTLLPTYTFNDDRFSSPLPFVRVLARNNYQDPVTLSARFENGILSLTSFNAASISIDKAYFPDSKLESIRWNETLFTLPKQSRVILGEEVPLNTSTKSKIPSTFANMFQADPLYIVYQDYEASEAYLAKTKQIANCFSKMDLKGLPKSDLSLPLIPLSEYQSKSMLRHRVIFIGKSERFESWIPNWLKQKIGGSETDAFALLYPPSALPKAKLAFFLSANDVEGLEKLEQTYLSSTALFNKVDLQLYQKTEGEYAFFKEETFDSYFGISQLPNVALTLPPLPQKQWEAFGKALLNSYTGAEALVFAAPLARNSSTIDFMTLDALTTTLSTDPFALIHLNTLEAFHTFSRLLKADLKLLSEGLEPFFEEGTKNLLRTALEEKISVLVDKSFLSLLTESQLEALKPEPFPFTLPELVWMQVKETPEEFAKKILEEEDIHSQEWTAEEATHGADDIFN